MAIKKRNGLVILTKTTWRRNRYTKNISISEKQLEAIIGGDIDEIEVYAPDYEYVIARITDPIEAASKAEISLDGNYYLICYENYLIKK